MERLERMCSLGGRPHCSRGELAGLSTGAAARWLGGVAGYRQAGGRLLALGGQRSAHEHCPPMLAEYLVALAMHDPAPLRIEWAPHDVLSPEGINIEVKSSSYCQSWRQHKLSALSFGRLSGLPLSDDGSEFLGTERELRADVFVFAIQICREPMEYDALDLSPWEFRVVPAAVLRAHGARSISYAAVLRFAPQAVAWDGLRAASAPGR